MSFSDDGLEDFKDGPQHSTPIKGFEKERYHNKTASSNLVAKDLKKSQQTHQKSFPNKTHIHCQQIHPNNKWTTLPVANSSLTLEEVSAIEGSFMRPPSDGMLPPDFRMSPNLNDTETASTRPQDLQHQNQNDLNKKNQRKHDELSTPNDHFQIDTYNSKQQHNSADVQINRQNNKSMTWAAYLLNNNLPREYPDENKISLYNLEHKTWCEERPRLRDSEVSSDKVNSPAEMPSEGRNHLSDASSYNQRNFNSSAPHGFHSDTPNHITEDDSFSDQHSNNRTSVPDTMFNQSAIFALSDPKKCAAHIEKDVISKQRREILLLMEELGTRDRELNDLVRSHRVQVNQWNKDRERMGELQHRLREYEEELEKNDNHLRDTISEMSQVTKQKEVDEKELNFTRARIKELQVKVEEEKTKVHNIETENLGLKESVHELTTIRHQMETRETDLEGQIKIKDKLLLESERREEFLDDEVKSIKVTLKDTKEKLEKSEAECQNWRRKFCLAQDDADKIEAECKSKDETIKSNQVQLHESLQQAIALQKALFTAGEREKCKEEVLHSIKRQNNRTMQELANLRMLYDRQNKDLTLYHLSVREKESKQGRHLRCKSWEKHSRDCKDSKHRRQRSLSNGKQTSESFLVKRGRSSKKDRKGSSSNEASLDRSHGHMDQSEKTPERLSRKDLQLSKVDSVNAATSMSYDKMPSSIGPVDIERLEKVNPIAVMNQSSEFVKELPPLNICSEDGHIQKEISDIPNRSIPNASNQSVKCSNDQFSDTSLSRETSPERVDEQFEDIQSADSDGMCPELERPTLSSLRSVSRDSPSSVLGDLPAKLQTTATRTSFLKKDLMVPSRRRGKGQNQQDQQKQQSQQQQQQQQNLQQQQQPYKQQRKQLNHQYVNEKTEHSCRAYDTKTKATKTLDVNAKSLEILTDSERIKNALSGSNHSGGDSYIKNEDEDTERDRKHPRAARRAAVHLQSGDSYFVSEETNYQLEDTARNARASSLTANSQKDVLSCSDSQDLSLFEDQRGIREKQVAKQNLLGCVDKKSIPKPHNNGKDDSHSSDSYDDKTLTLSGKACKNPSFNKILRNKVYNSNSFPNEASLSPKHQNSSILNPNKSDGQLSNNSSPINQRTNKGRPGVSNISQRGRHSSYVKNNAQNPCSYDRYCRNDVDRIRTISPSSEKFQEPFFDSLAKQKTHDNDQSSASLNIKSMCCDVSNTPRQNMNDSKSQNLITIMRKPECSVSVNEKPDLKRKCLRFSSVQQSISPDRVSISDSCTLSETGSSLSSQFKEKTLPKEYTNNSRNNNPHSRPLHNTQHSAYNSNHENSSFQEHTASAETANSHQEHYISSSTVSSEKNNRDCLHDTQNQNLYNNKPVKDAAQQRVRASWSGSSRGSQSERSTNSQLQKYNKSSSGRNLKSQSERRIRSPSDLSTSSHSPRTAKVHSERNNKGEQPDSKVCYQTEKSRNTEQNLKNQSNANYSDKVHRQDYQSDRTNNYHLDEKESENESHFSRDYFYMKSERRTKELSSSDFQKHSPSKSRYKHSSTEYDSSDQETPQRRKHIGNNSNNNNNNNNELIVNTRSDNSYNVSSSSVDLNFNPNGSVDCSQINCLDNVVTDDRSQTGSDFDDLNKLDSEEKIIDNQSQPKPFCVARAPSLYNQLAKIHFCEKSKRYEWVSGFSGNATGSENTSQCLGECSEDQIEQSSATSTPLYVQHLLNEESSLKDYYHPENPLLHAPLRSRQFSNHQPCEDEESDTGNHEKPSFISPEAQTTKIKKMETDGLQPVVKKLDFSLTFEDTDNDVTPMLLKNDHHSSPSDVRLKFSDQDIPTASQQNPFLPVVKRHKQNILSYNQSFDDISAQQNISLEQMEHIGSTLTNIETLNGFRKSPDYDTDRMQDFDASCKNVSEYYHVNLPVFNSNKSLELQKKTINLTEYFKDISGIELNDDNDNDSAFKDMVEQVSEPNLNVNGEESQKEISIVKENNDKENTNEHYRPKVLDYCETKKGKILLDHSEQTSQLMRLSSVEFLSLDLGSSCVKSHTDSLSAKNKQDFLQKNTVLQTDIESESLKHEKLLIDIETPRLVPASDLNTSSYLEEPSVDTGNSSSLVVAMSPASKLHRLLLDSQEMVRRLERGAGAPGTTRPQMHY